MKNIRVLLIYAITGGGILLLSEWLLREVWGGAHAPLYKESESYEYIVQPNQDGYRFGRHFHYNSYSQRCEEPDSTKTIILGLGDSVIFGGAMLDQDSIATTLFTNETGIQMLNISAGSWGPDNCAAYHKENGSFGAKAMWLIASSHDAHDIMDHEKVVGVHLSYPDKQYFCAWAELIDRYLLSRIKETVDKFDPDQKVLKGEIRKKGESFNPGFYQLKIIADSIGIPLFICLHPDKNEVSNNRYSEQGDEIISWCYENDILLVEELKEGISLDMYRDNILRFVLVSQDGLNAMVAMQSHGQRSSN